MRLLLRSNTGEFGLTKEFVGDDITPPYAILSHTWREGEEVTFKDLIEGTGQEKAGYEKIRFCGQQAERDGLQHFWLDTCCIDKSSSAELSEAINSMFRWYHDAAKCYVYLSDVSVGISIGSDLSSQRTWKPAFRNSRWFTRGWTLQELIAPTSVEFFSADGERLGDKVSLVEEIHGITGICVQALQGRPLSEFSVDERMSWAERRETKRGEDAAYCLLGIFNIHIPPIYGEGRRQALNRLKKEIKGDNSTKLPIAKGAPFDSHTEDHISSCEYMQKRFEEPWTAVVERGTDITAQTVAVQKNQSLLQRLLSIIAGDNAAQIMTMKELVSKACVSTQKICDVVFEIRSTLSAAPSTRWTFFQDPVRFEDALGRMTLFPSEFSVDDLEAIIERRFQKGPGKQHVQAGDYELCNTRNTRQVISASDGVGLLPGMHVRMAIVIKRSTSSGDFCPMPRCRSSNTESVSGGGRKCCNCSVWFDQSSKKRKWESAVLEDREISEGFLELEPRIDLPEREKKMPRFWKQLPKLRGTGFSNDFEAFKNVRVDSNRTKVETSSSSEGEITFVEKLNMACGNPRNSIPRPMSHSSQSNDAFPIMDFGSPFSFGDTSAVQKPNPLEEIERQQDGGDDEVVPGEDPSQMLNCHRIWDKLSNRADFKDGTIDIDGLCFELRARARCSENGVVVDHKDVEAALRRLPKD